MLGYLYIYNRVPYTAIGTLVTYYKCYYVVPKIYRKSLKSNVISRRGSSLYRNNHCGNSYNELKNTRLLIIINNRSI